MHNPLILKILFVVAIVSSFSCKEAPRTTYEESKAKIVTEVKPLQIPLSGKVAKPEIEISGLTWFGDKLILLPQFPISQEDSVGNLFYIEKSEIIKFLDSDSNLAIEPKALKIVAIGLDEFNSRGSGFEAITFNGNDVYLSIESMNFFDTFAYLIKGEFDSTCNQIVLDKKTLMKVESNSGIDNHSEEAISTWNSKLSYGIQFQP